MGGEAWGCGRHSIITNKGVVVLPIVRMKVLSKKGGWWFKGSFGHQWNGWMDWCRWRFGTPNAEQNWFHWQCQMNNFLAHHWANNLISNQSSSSSFLLELLLDCWSNMVRVLSVKRNLLTPRKHLKYTLSWSSASTPGFSALTERKAKHNILVDGWGIKLLPLVVENFGVW